MDTVVTTTKNPWSSTINWSQAIGSLLSLGAAFGLSTSLTADQIMTLVLAVQGLVGVFVVVKNTWFSPQVITQSATDLKAGP